jgi:hypothetical protein
LARRFPLEFPFFMMVKWALVNVSFYIN